MSRRQVKLSPFFRFTTLVLPLAALFSTTAGCATSVCKDAWLGTDKTRHFAAGFAIGAATTTLARIDGARPGRGAAAGLGAVAVAGTAKEAFDLKVRSTCWSWKDLVWDLIGGAAGTAVGTAAGH